jgi:hypothetical protein
VAAEFEARAPADATSSHAGDRVQTEQGRPCSPRSRATATSLGINGSGSTFEALAMSRVNVDM